MRSRGRVTSDPPYYYKAPERVLEELGIEEPQDIRIEAIAQHCGATILYEPLEGSEARLLGYRNRALITVDSGAAASRQRFSAAHELGHWMWDRGKMAFACAERQFNGEWSGDNPERRANRYAEELLLPEPMFRREAEGQPLLFATVQRLSQSFQTSLTATAIRFVELASRPALLVCTEAGKRRWYARSAPVPWNFRLTTLVSPQAYAASLVGNRENSVGQGNLPSELWLEHRDGKHPLPPLPPELWEDSIRIGSELVLTLLTW